MSKKFKVITIANNKGGVGKTTITWNLMYYLAVHHNHKILVIDNDAQHNMSNILYKLDGHVGRLTNDKVQSNREYSTGDIYHGIGDASTLVRKTKYKNIDIISATVSLTATELYVNQSSGKELFLRNWLLDNTEYLNRYDYIFIDCNPSMNSLNINAFHASDSIVLISDVDPDGLEGVRMFMELYYPIRRRLDRVAVDNIKGLIINKVDERTTQCREFLDFVSSDKFEYPDLMFDTKIHNAAAIAETKLNQTGPDKNGRSHEELLKLIDEMKGKEIL